MLLAEYSKTAIADWRRRLIAPGWAALIVGAVMLSLVVILSQPVGGAALAPLPVHVHIIRAAEPPAPSDIVHDAEALAHADMIGGVEARMPSAASDSIAIGIRPAVGVRSTTGDRPAAGDRLAVGDRLSIGVFEKYATMEDVERSATFATLVERTEISGEQTIQADGTISAPFIGVVPAAVMSPADLEAALAEAYAAVLGGEISVVVRILEREPVYVTGAIQTSAALDYRPSMIVMHALAVTGTSQKINANDWQHLDMARERVRVHQARTRLADLLGRASVLLTNAGRPDTASERLAEQIGQQEAQRRLAEARRVFELEDAQRSAEKRAAERSAELIEGELAIVIESLGDAESDMRVKSERAVQFEAHLASGLTTDSQVQIVRNERAEAVSNWNSLRATRSRLERSLAEARQTAIRIELGWTVDREQEIQSLRAAIAQEEQVLGSLAPVLDQGLHLSADREPLEQDLELEIVRRTPTGIERLEADLYTRLQPGDILDVRRRSDGGYQFVAL